MQSIGTTLQLSDVSLPIPTTGGSVQTLGAYVYDFGAKVKMLQTHKVWPALWILFAKHSCVFISLPEVKAELLQIFLYVRAIFII